MLFKNFRPKSERDAKNVHALTFGSRYTTEPVPKYTMPERSLPANVAYEIVHDELELDGNPRLNLASFVTTWMEPEAKKLMAESVDKNYVDQDEYPQTTEIQNRCVNMVAHLFNAPEDKPGVGTATVGSSEAIHLAGLALKWKWRARRQAEGLPADKPNIVMGANVQVCWEKFARYFEVEPRYVPLTETRYVLGVEEALQLVDENTIAVVGILGSTYTGEYEPIKQLNDALDKQNKKTGRNVPIHVDAASGGFVAPFVTPQLEWDFRLPLVKSINVSGHKYGLVFPGIGWVVWRNEDDLPKDLVFHVNYLGGDQPTFNLNFSRSANQIIAQYYNFLSLGREGYTRIMKSLCDVASGLVKDLEASGKFTLLSKRNQLPVVTFRLNDSSRFTVFDLSNKLRERGWIVPAYTMAPNAQDISVLRIVIREGFSRDMADMLLDDLFRAIDDFEKAPQPTKKPEGKEKTLGVC